MGSVERKNIWELYQIRKKEGKTDFYYLKGIVALFFLIDIIDFCGTFLWKQETVLRKAQSYPLIGLLGGILLSFALAYHYREESERYQAFPHTKSSLFFSYVLYNYIAVIKLVVFGFLLYLFQYILNYVIGAIFGNIILVYQFSALFIFAGIWVNIGYALLVSNLFIFLGALDRKFSWYFRILVLVGIGSAIYTKMLMEGLMDIMKFWTLESSLGIFSLKVLLPSLIMLGVSYLLNKKCAVKATKKLKSKSVVAAVLGLIILIGFTSIGTLVVGLEETEYVTEEHTVSLKEEQPERKYEYKIDFSNLKNEKLKIVVKNEDLEKYLDVDTATEDNREMYGLSEQEGIVNLPRDMMVINGIDIERYPYYENNVQLEGNELKIERKKIATVVFLNPCFFMESFTCFQGKEYYQITPYGYGSTIQSKGELKLVVPPDIPYSIE